MSDKYHSKHAKSNAGAIIVRIVIIVLCVALLGGGAFGLYHFVLEPKLFAPTEATAPPINDTATLAPDPTHAPEPTEPSLEDKAKAYVDGMSDYEKMMQLFIVSPEGLFKPEDEVDVVTFAGEMTEEAIEKYPVGGIVYTDINFTDAAQTTDLIKKTQGFSKIPLFIAVDEEGGEVARVASKLGTTQLNPMFSYKDEGEATAKKNATTIANDIKKFGFNLDFAPVADVLSNETNTVIGTRAYSDDPETASKLVTAAMQGFSESGIIPTLKHFPGHGSTAEDSHEGAAHVTKSRADLTATDLVPFKAGIDAGADLIMIGHITVDDVDDSAPATLSSKVVPELLRGELGYNGLTVTDALNMNALSQYTTDEIVRGVFAADIDMFLLPNDLEEYITAIQTALHDGTIKQEDIDKRVVKIIELKMKYGLIPDASAQSATASTDATESSAPSETAALTDESTGQVQ